MNIIISTILTGIAIINSFFGLNNLKNSTDTKIEIIDQKVQSLEQKSEQAPVAGAFSPSGGLTYRLQTSAATTDTSITLSSFKNRSNIALTMTLLGTDVIYGTLDPQTTRSEFISCTGITQNSNGTATLTTCTRGLSDIGASTASTTLRKSHPGQSIFILSDSPALFNEYAKLRTSETISGDWIFSGNPTLTTDCTVGSATTELCAKAYIDGVAVAGASNANTTTKGIIEIATAVENASSTSAGSTGALLVPPATIASSSPKRSCKDGGASVGELCIVVAQNNGKIDPNYIATSTTDNYNFGGSVALNGTNTHLGLNTFNATSTFATTTQNGAQFGGNIVNNFTGGKASINGLTTPVPVMLATSTNQVSPIDSDVASTSPNLIGFVINNCGLATTCYVQTDGIVKGFSGLTAGQEYYVSDTEGVLSTTRGTIENYVGRAVSTSQILIDKNKANQYIGTQVLSEGANTITAGYQSLWNTVIITGSVDDLSGDITLKKVGKTSGSLGVHVYGGGSAISGSFSVSGGVITLTKGGAASTINGTAYYYK